MTSFTFSGGRVSLPSLRPRAALCSPSRYLSRGVYGFLSSVFACHRDHFFATPNLCPCSPLRYMTLYGRRGKIVSRRPISFVFFHASRVFFRPTCDPFIWRLNILFLAAVVLIPRVMGEETFPHFRKAYLFSRKACQAVSPCLRKRVAASPQHRPLLNVYIYILQPCIYSASCI